MIKKELANISENLGSLPNNSFFQYIKWINKSYFEVDNNSDFINKYKPIIDSKEKSDVFLSVVMRTQGKRPEMLREVLLTLCAQKCQDFEIVLVGHNISKENDIIVNTIINEQEEQFRGKIRYIKVEGGTRTTPLNYGFAHAKGKYISILDDDDYVYDNWVSCFADVAGTADGKILHAFVLTQEWEIVETEEGDKALRAKGAPFSRYCVKSDYYKLLVDNFSPPLGFAFPSYLFHELGIIFDESLTTNEDWDYILKTAYFAGIYDIMTPTSVYRIIDNGENSKTEHKIEEWENNYYDIQGRAIERPILIPASGIDKNSVDRKQSTEVKFLLERCESLKSNIDQLNYELNYIKDSRSYKISKKISRIWRSIGGVFSKN